jgi:PAS domain S-box-containing protein
MGDELSSDLARLTHQLQATEAALRESEARFRTLIDAAPVLVWMSGPDKRCTFFNQPWLAFTGRTLEQERGDGWAEGVHAEDLPACLETYGSSFDARRPFTMEYRLRRADGQYRWVLDTGVPRHTPEGQFVGYIGSCIDITERRLAELEAARQREELAHLSRVLLVGELSGALAHELNQPLTAILTNVRAAQRLLEQGAVEPAELQEILSDIAEGGHRATEVIRRLRLLLKKGELQRQPLHVNEVVGDALKLMRSDLVRRRVTVETNLARDLPAVVGDAVQLQQVLLNLLVNGCEAMAGVEGPERRLRVRTEWADGQGVRVSIIDRGSGIAPEHRERLFEPFFTTKGKGLGLGLAICRTLIAAHGGSFWATNNPDRGATFQFTLPPTGAA